MTPKRIFVLNGHPAETSLSRTLADHYARGAEAAGHEVRLVHLHDLTFDMDYEFGGYTVQKPLERSIEESVLENLEWCDHWVLAAPLWWGGLPAKLKGLFDRVLLPGRTYDTRNTTLMGMPKPMLTGRTARVIMTSDTPRWFLTLAYGAAIVRQLRGQIFGFVGFKPTRVTWLSGASHPDEARVAAWQARSAALGRAAA